MAKVILKIGYNKFYLPSDRGVLTVLNTLSKALAVDEDLSRYRTIHSPKVFVENDDPTDMSVIVLSPRDVVRRLKKRAALSEKAGPDADGRNITKRD